MATTTLAPPGYAVDPRPARPVATLFPPSLRLLTPFLNITGAFALILGAVFSTYVFMPKRRVLAYSLDPNQPGDEFLFNLLIAPVAIIGQPRRLAARRGPGAARGPAPQPRPGDDPDRDRRVHPDARRHAQPVRHDRVVPARQVPRRAVPVRRLPRLDRGLPRDPDPVHLDQARPARATSRPAPRRWRPPRIPRRPPTTSTEGAGATARDARSLTRGRRGRPSRPGVGPTMASVSSPRLGRPRAARTDPGRVGSVIVVGPRRARDADPRPDRR